MRVLDVLNESFERSLRDPDRFTKLAKARLDSRDSVGLAEHFGLQDALRPLFGKGPSVAPSIGDHQGYAHIKISRVPEHGAITTLFLDMEGSTRLGLVYGPTEAYRIKNAVIQATIDIIKSFDGHVHRIMGDAVMAFFGSKKATPQDGAVDAINCATALRALMGNLIDARFPEMNQDKFGIRVGVDFAPAERVIWAAYGYPNMEEITATSFFVDAASKLQHAAGRNQIMFGQSLVELLDVPDGLLSAKSVVRDGQPVSEPFLLPNYTGADGKPTNYRKYIFEWQEYLKCTPLSRVLGFGEDLLARVDVARERKDATIERRYFPSASCLEKARALRFSVTIPVKYRLPIDVEFSVENHGAEASEEDDNGNHSEMKSASDSHIIHWEDTAYKGLHYLNIRVLSQSRQVASSRFGVWIR